MWTLFSTQVSHDIGHTPAVLWDGGWGGVRNGKTFPKPDAP